jgi:hypothetical protein
VREIFKEEEGLLDNGSVGERCLRSQRALHPFFNWSQRQEIPLLDAMVYCSCTYIEIGPSIR